MSSLTQNLQTIYGIKNQIKEVIGTQSDLFEEYPDLISAAIADAGGEGLDWDDVATAGYIVPTGTLNISENGSSIDVASYAYANVAVPIPAGYIVPSGTKSIASNGSNIDVTAYAAVDVAVPIPAGYIIPAGTITIDDNEIGNTVDVSAYANAYIDITGGGSSVNLGTLYATENGVYDPQDEGWEGYNSVEVEVTPEVTQDGKYAFFHLTEENSPLGGFTAIPCTDFFDGQNATVWENIEFYTGIYRDAEVLDPNTNQLTICNSYYSIEVRDSNYNLTSIYSTCYDCSNPYAIHLSGTLAADTLLSFYLTWNHGTPEPDENDPNTMIANWTQENLGEIGFTPYDAESGSQSIMVVVSQKTSGYQVEGEIESAKLYIQDSDAVEYHIQDEWEESE